MTAIEDQARASVRAYLENVRGDLQPDAMSIFRRAPLRLKVMSLEGSGRAARVVYDDEKAAPLIRRAQHDPDAAAELREVAREFFARAEALPQRLGEYILRAAEIGPPRSRPDKKTSPLRKVQIVMAVSIAVEAGLSLTRNEASYERESSACSLVAAELGRLGIKISAKRIHEYWVGLADFVGSEGADTPSA